jgi:aminopeptidase N
VHPVRGRAIAGLLAACVLVAACSDADSSVTAGQSSAVVVDPTGDTVPDATDTGTDSTDGDAPAVSLPAPDPTDPEGSLPPEPGAPDGPRTDPDGIGDRLFPELGNPGIDVVDMHVDLTYEPTDDTLAGSVTLVIDATEDRDEFTLDSDGPEVSAVTVDGVEAGFEQDGVELRITPDGGIADGDRLEVLVEYTAVPDPSTGADGLPAGWFNSDGGSYTLNEPDGARSWLPSNDHPSDKATWTFEFTVPTGLTVVTNGLLVSTTTGPDGDTWIWRQDDPMATYLIQVLTGDYEIVEGEGPNGLPLVSAVLRGDRQRMQPYLDSIDDQIVFFEPLFGPYPLTSYGIAMTDSFPGLAMETQGRSTFSRDDFSGQEGFVEQLLLSHELAHQWFGDAVTPADWQDIWLNESFATYAQWLWLDHVGQQSLDDAASGALRGRIAQQGSAPATPSVPEMFGFNSYDGGAVVLEALRRTVGDDAFFETLQRWVADNEGRSQRTAAFIALAEDVSGQDLTELFDEWLFASDVPRKFPERAAAV